MIGNPLFDRPGLILFDVYETLLDMSEIRRRVNSALDSKKGFMIWFEQLMQYCFLDNCIGQFHDFTSIAKATLQMTGKNLGVPVAEDTTDRILHLMKHLPLQEGVPEGLSRLYDKGFRLAALTNSPKNIVDERMNRTGLISYFEKVFSGEEIRKFKPACEVYQWAAKCMGVEKGECLMVTAHGWDVAGAHFAGMMTAYIQRPNRIMYPLAPKPSIVVKSLEELSRLIP